MTVSANKRLRQFTPKEKHASFGAYDLSERLLEQIRESTGVNWPSAKYREDPVAFAREILGVEPWDKQVELIEAVRDYPRGAVRSGHKVSKSHSIGIVSLWYFCSFPDAKVVLSSTTARQVDDILWLEIRKLLARGGKCAACKASDPDDETISRPCPHSALIPEKPGEKARTGLRSLDFRFIVGFTAREAEAVAGVSGKNLLYLIDEASGVPDHIFEAIDGNRAGGARFWMFSNPTRNEGEHYAAFNSKAEFYKTITISSTDSPNYRERRVVIPGLAEYEWVEEKRLEYGEDSAFFKIRILGLHAEKEDLKIFSVHRITEAEQRWMERARWEGEGDVAYLARTQSLGRLYIGIDLAGETGSGDEEFFAPRRGPHVFELVKQPASTNEMRMVNVLGMIERMKKPREIPVVVFDREGSIGSSFMGFIRDWTERNPGVLEYVAVRASDRAHRTPMVHDRMRDELTANLDRWLSDGGSIPSDTKLEAEMHAMEWEQQPGSGRYKVVPPKRELKKTLKRSPDRYDALALSCWEPMHLREGFDEGAAPSVREREKSNVRAQRGRDDDDGDEFAPLVDPYAAEEAWRR